MAFCGQCGLLLNPNIVNCPRCGTVADFNASVPGAPTNDNSATVIADAHTPAPPDTLRSAYPATGQNRYPDQGTVPPLPQSGSNYPTPDVIIPPNHPQSGNNYGNPGAVPPNYMLQGYNQTPSAGTYPPNTYPGTDPNYPYPPQIPPRKTRVLPIILTIVLVLLFLVATSATIFAVGPDRIAGLFGQKNTPIPQPTATTQVVATTPPVQNTPTTPSYPTAQPSPTTPPTQQAQATIQQYYDDINTQNYQAAYDLWVNYPDPYATFKQGFAHTHSDVVTFGTITPQTDGTVLVNATLQSTEDATTGTGTQGSTYRGYYIVGQQADGSWKILKGNFNRV